MRRTTIVAAAVLALAAAGTPAVSAQPALPALPAMPAFPAPALPALPALPGMPAVPPELLAAGAVVGGLTVAAVLAMMLGGPAGSAGPTGSAGGAGSLDAGSLGMLGSLDVGGSLGSLMPQPTNTPKPTGTTTTTTTRPEAEPEPPVEPGPFDPVEGDTVDIDLAVAVTGTGADGRAAAGEELTYTAALDLAADGQGIRTVQVTFVPDATQKITAVDFTASGCVLVAGNRVGKSTSWYFSCGEAAEVSVSATVEGTAEAGADTRAHFALFGTDSEGHRLSAMLQPATLDGRPLDDGAARAIGDPLIAALPLTIGTQY